MNELRACICIYIHTMKQQHLKILKKKEANPIRYMRAFEYTL